MNKIKFNWQNNQKGEIDFLKGDPQLLIPQLLNKNTNRLFIIMDNLIDVNYPDLKAAINIPFLILSGGEKIKTIATVERINGFLHENRCSRWDILVVIGGGCLGDTAGFAASVYKRGIEWIFFPTTLLAQIDSSIGGKVAINNAYGKNQLGAFWLAGQVYILDEFLKTLDQRQYNSGMAEIIKVGILEQGELLSALESDKIPSALELANLSVKAKLKLIDDDWYEKENGTRMGLNFGHTIAHGLEKIVPDLLHGEAVAVGMFTELLLAQSHFKKLFCLKRLENLLLKFNLSTDIRQYINDSDWQTFSIALAQDKKNFTDDISFVIPIQDGTIKKLCLSLEHLRTNLFKIN